MMKRTEGIILVVLYLVFACSVSLSYAEGDLKRFDATTKSCRTLTYDSYWFGKGGRLFEQKCKPCHTRKNDVNAPFLHVESKSRRGWNRVFFKKYPKCAKTGAWKITDEEALLINDYLFRYAANTHNAYKAS